MSESLIAHLIFIYYRPDEKHDVLKNTDYT
jgi:hypothetical protein